MWPGSVRHKFNLWSSSFPFVSMEWTSPMFAVFGQNLNLAPFLWLSYQRYKSTNATKRHFSDLNRTCNYPLINMTARKIKFKHRSTLWDQNHASSFNMCSPNQSLQTLKQKWHSENWSLWKFKCFVPLTVTLVHAFITSHLDYCHGLLFGLPKTQIAKYQCIQNAAARLILGIGKFSHITSVLYELHWLPVSLRIDYEILLLTFKCIYGL